MIDSNNYNIEEIDRKLDEDILKHKKHVKKVAIIILVIIAFIFRGQIFYWLKFGLAFPYKNDNKPISVLEDPVQVNYTEEQRKEKTFVYKSLLNGNKITLIPVADYKISGLVVATNRFFLIKTEFFDSAALYDIGISWGRLGDKKFYKKYFECFSRKNEVTGARMLWTHYKTLDMPVTLDYATSHWSHTHVVPANNNIMGAMLRVHEWDKIEMEGMLVDMEYENPKKRRKYFSHTSMSRTDSDPGDRGNGSCEVMYVTKVKLRNKVYK